MLATRSDRSPKLFRGWCGFGSIKPISIIWPKCPARSEVSSSTKCRSWRMRRSVGNPLPVLDTSDDLLRQFVVLDGTRRGGREAEDRLPVCRALLEPDALADRRLEDLRPEHRLDLALDVLREDGPPVEQCDDDPEKLEVGIRPGADLLE